MKFTTPLYVGFLVLGACTARNESSATATRQADKTKLEATLISDQVTHDADDPAIWIDPQDKAKSLVIGTDKDSDGALFVFDLEGKVLKKVDGLKRPNNVDIAYGLSLNGNAVDIAVVTERETNKIRIFSLPDLKPIDNGGISVFEGEQEKAPMGIALYTSPAREVYAIVGRKNGPSGTYLWQYKLEDDGKGMVKGEVVRKFGAYSGKKEIESIAVDNELGYVYYSDEQYGVHKYYADPSKGNQELILFGQGDFKDDIEGISIYKHADGTGYLLISNQQDYSFNIYPREGEHKLIVNVPVSATESDGSEVTSTALGSRFPKGLFVAMSNERTFHFYDWTMFQKRIDAVK